MATYTAPEIQQMKEGGNAAFASKYLAKWNSSSFPAPVDKNPKKVEEFVKQVLVDKVFYSETPVENKTEPLKSTAVSSRSLLSQMSSRSMKVENSWQAFSEEARPAASGQKTGSSTGGNWAEFPSVLAKQTTQTLDPFPAPSSIHASPKSVHSTPADPFAPQQQEKWDPFQDTANGTAKPVNPVQTGWSQFETKSEPVITEKPVEATSTPNGAAKPKPTVLDPLPEEWFSVGPTPAPQPQYPFPVQNTGAFQPAHQQPFVQQQLFQPMQHQTHFQSQPQQPYMQQPFGQPGGFGGVYQQGAVPQSSAFGYAQPQRPSLGSFPSFRSTAGVPPQWPQSNQGFATMQKQDSIASYASHRMEDAHNPLFQNLDMDMRAKAHSVAGVPIQPPARGLFQNSTTVPTGFNHTSNATPFQQSFFQAPPQTGFDEASGNPFA